MLHTQMQSELRWGKAIRCVREGQENNEGVGRKTNRSGQPSILHFTNQTKGKQEKNRNKNDAIKCRRMTEPQCLQLDQKDNAHTCTHSHTHTHTCTRIHTLRMAQDIGSG